MTSFNLFSESNPTNAVTFLSLPIFLRRSCAIVIRKRSFLEKGEKTSRSYLASFRIWRTMAPDQIGINASEDLPLHFGFPVRIQCKSRCSFPPHPSVRASERVPKQSGPCVRSFVRLPAGACGRSGPPSLPSSLASLPTERSKRLSSWAERKSFRSS